MKGKTKKKKSPLRAGKATKLVSVTVTPITAYFKPLRSTPTVTPSRHQPSSPSKSFKLSSTFSVDSGSKKKKTVAPLQQDVSPKEVERSTTEKPITPTSLGLNSLTISEPNMTSEREGHSSLVGKSPKRCISDSTDEEDIIDSMSIDIEMITPSPKKLCMVNLTESSIVIVDTSQEHSSPHNDDTVNVESIVIESECTLDEHQMKNEAIVESDGVETRERVKMDCQVTMRTNKEQTKCKVGHEDDNKVEEPEEKMGRVSGVDAKIEIGGQCDQNGVSEIQTGDEEDSESPISNASEDFNQLVKPSQSNISTSLESPLPVPFPSHSVSNSLQSNIVSMDRVSEPPETCVRKFVFCTPKERTNARTSISGDDDMSVYASYKTPMLPLGIKTIHSQVEFNVSLQFTATPSSPATLLHSTEMASCVTPAFEKGWQSSVVGLSSKELLKEVEVLLRKRKLSSVVWIPASRVKLFGSVQWSVVTNLLEVEFRSLANKVHSLIEFLTLATSPLTIPGSKVLVGVWDIIIDPHVTMNNLSSEVLNECLTWFHRLLILHPPGQHSLVDTQYSLFLRDIGGEEGTFGLWDTIASLHNGPRYHSRLLSFIIDLLLIDARNAITHNTLDDSLFVRVFWLCASDHHLTSPIRKLVDFITQLLQNFTLSDLEFSKLDNLMSLLFLAGLRCSDLKTELLLVCQKLTHSSLALFISHLQPQLLCDQLIKELPQLEEKHKQKMFVNVHSASKSEEIQLQTVGNPSAVWKGKDIQVKSGSLIALGSEEKCENDPQNVAVGSSLLHPQTEDPTNVQLMDTVCDSSSESLLNHDAVSCVQETKREVKDISETLIKFNINSLPPEESQCTTTQSNVGKELLQSSKVTDTKSIPIVTRNKTLLPASSKPLTKVYVTRSTTTTMATKSGRAKIVSQPAPPSNSNKVIVTRSTTMANKSGAAVLAPQQVKKQTNLGVKTQKSSSTSGGGRGGGTLRSNAGVVRKCRANRSCENCTNGRCARCRKAMASAGHATTRMPWK